MTSIKFYPLIRGISSYLLPKSIFTHPGSGGTFSSEYCYSVWLRHLYYLITNGLFDKPEDIKRIAEIGPGDSLGIGICALYTGAREYYAFDVLAHANQDKNIKISNEIHSYFDLNSDIPNTYRQRFTAPLLPNYSFPEFLKHYSNEHYSERKKEINMALKGNPETNTKIEYIVPWEKSTRTDIEKLDLIISQAVMEHVNDIRFAYEEMYKWLKPGGVISHQIDFKSHEMTHEWNGHWFIGEKLWNILAHGRKYPMNRLPLSSHIKTIEMAGFEVKFVLPIVKDNKFGNRTPKVPNVKFDKVDLNTSSALIQAVKI
ncbi:MAG: methyltransferase domain-containing protein [Bacteroidia bacterium]